MSTQARLEPVDATTDDMELLHTVCCRDSDTLLCGMDGAGEPWDQGGVLCVDCEVTANRGDCPKFTRCLEDELTCN